MRTWLRALNELLRGDLTTSESLARGDVMPRVRMFAPWAIVLGASYGFFMGWFALTAGHPDAWKQLLASTVKLPMLFLLTLAVTFPSLFVFNALVGTRLGAREVLRLLIGSIVVSLAVGASLGPILGFFTLSTTSYAFMIVLNVALLGIGGVCGLAFLLSALRRIRATAAPGADPRASDVQGDLPPETDLRPPSQRPRTSTAPGTAVFRIWIVIYGLVGAQMAWLLRPFIGSPGAPFEWFRERQGNFFSSVVASIQRLLGF